MSKRLLLFLLVYLSVLAVKGKSYDITGCVYSAVGKLPVVGCKVLLYQEKGTLLDSTRTKTSAFNGIKRPTFGFYDLVEGKYTLVFEDPVYEPYSYELTISKRKSTDIYLDFFYLHPRKHPQDIRLGEAVKRATRIKLFHKGDTLVFDADAFSLAKGSMLDALIAKLPGVKLKENGEITVNGETVDELLLNGKDFFRGDRMILLENMPSYMVKNVKVYRRDDLFRKEEKKPLTMDVVLKKEYRSGWIANAEAAGGSSDRYLGRLFGLRFTDHSRLGLFGNINNTNDTRRPGSDGNWNGGLAEYGTQKTKKAGLDFYTEDLLSKWRFNTANTITDTRRNTDAEQQTVAFLPAEKVYGKSESRSKGHDLTFVSNNTLNLDLGNEDALIKSTSLQITLNLSYRNNHSSLWSKAMESEIAFDSLADYTSLFSYDSSESRLYSSLLNRSNFSDNVRSHRLNASGGLSILHRLKKSMDILSGFLNWDYQDENATSYTQNSIEYLRTEQATDYRHNHQRTPVKGASISAGGDYRLIRNNGWNYTFNIGYRHQYQSSDRSLFNLHKLAGWDFGSHHEVAELPSTRDEMQSVQDILNSYYSSTYADNGEIGLKAFYWHQWDNGTNLNTYVRIPFSLQYDKLKYRRNLIDTTLTRTNRFLLPVFYFDLQLPKNNTLHLDYRLTKTAPSLVNRLNIRDDVNPLNIIEGNAQLKNTTRNEVELSYQKTKMAHYASFNSRIRYQIVSNALAMGFLYDTEIGIRTTRPDNVNGNWQMDGSTDFTRCLDKKDHITLETSTGYGYLHSVDLTGTTAVERSVVNTFNLNEDISLKYKIGTNTVGIKGKIAWSNINSDRTGFSSMNVTDFSYGLTALLNLPWKLQLNTDLTIYSRRGYESASMNTNDLVWNARLARTFLGGSLTCFIDGFDLLGNLSNVVRKVNAQGRTETRYNVVPRYAMIHVIYRLNKEPKKKNQ